jgi:hypothetical protein
MAKPSRVGGKLCLLVDVYGAFTLGVKDYSINSPNTKLVI